MTDVDDRPGRHAPPGRSTWEGDVRVNRPGYGTMQLTGPASWGPPRGHAEAIGVLRRAVVERSP